MPKQRRFFRFAEKSHAKFAKQIFAQPGTIFFKKWWKIMMKMNEGKMNEGKMTKMNEGKKARAERAPISPPRANSARPGPKTRSKSGDFELKIGQILSRQNLRFWPRFLPISRPKISDFVRNHQISRSGKIWDFPPKRWQAVCPESQISPEIWGGSRPVQMASKCPFWPQIRLAGLGWLAYVRQITLPSQIAIYASSFSKKFENFW